MCIYVNINVTIHIEYMDLFIFKKTFLSSILMFWRCKNIKLRHRNNVVEPDITWNKCNFSSYEVSVGYGSGHFCSSAEQSLPVCSRENSWSSFLELNLKQSFLLCSSLEEKNYTFFLILPVRVEGDPEVLLALWDTVSLASFLGNAFPVPEDVGGTCAWGKPRVTESSFLLLFFLGV